MSENDRAPRPATSQSATPLRELALLFLKLGTIAFGGPAAHIAMMEDEVVRRRRWLTREQFLDLLGATNLIPGPNSTELAIHIGHRQAGWPGLVVAGVCFILPAALIVAGPARGPTSTTARCPRRPALLYGVKPVIIAVVVQALWGLGRTARQDQVLAVAGAGSCAWPLGCGRPRAASLLVRGWAVGCSRPVGGSPPAKRSPRASASCRACSLRSAQRPRAARAVRAVAAVPRLPQDRCGAVRQRLRAAGVPARRPGRALGWLTEAQLLDAVAVGQVTPGPVFTTATFIGYVLGRAGGGSGGDGRHLPAGVRLRGRSAGRSCRACAARRSPARSSTA